MTWVGRPPALCECFKHRQSTECIGGYNALRNAYAIRIAAPSSADTRLSNANRKFGGGNVEGGSVAVSIIKSGLMASRLARARALNARLHAFRAMIRTSPLLLISLCHEALEVKLRTLAGVCMSHSLRWCQSKLGQTNENFERFSSDVTHTKAAPCSDTSRTASIQLRQAKLKSSLASFGRFKWRKNLQTDKGQQKAESQRILDSMNNVLPTTASKFSKSCNGVTRVRRFH